MPQQSAFADLAQTFLDEYFADSPAHASGLGLTQYDDQLDDLSEAAFDRRTAWAERWVRRLQTLDPPALTASESIDRDLILSSLRGRLIMADWQMWRRQPDTYLGPGLSGVHSLFLHRLRPEPELVRSAINRFRQVADALAHGKRNLQPELAPPIYVERALGQARAGARYARELVLREVSDKILRAELAIAGGAAADAFDDFATFLEQLRGQAHGEWAIGEERYSRLLREKEMLSFDARALRERGRAEYAKVAERLRQNAQRVAQTDDWPRVLHDLNLDHPTSPDAMRDAYAEWTERARQFLKDHTLVSFPRGEECAVVPSPVFQRPVLAVASYQSPPPFTSQLNGHFYVPFPPDGVSDEEIQRRLESNNFASIPTTAVHEAYPGHHWHLVTMQGNPSRVRKTFRTPYFTEGWALYAEQMMREQGFFADPRAEMAQYEATLFRAARIVVDTSLHMGEMPFDEAVQFMMDKANLPEPTARAEVGRYCSWPTQASSYLTGCLEILRIRQRFMDERGLSGADGLRQFHDTIAATGGLPIALAERAVLGAAPAAEPPAIIGAESHA